MDLPRRSDANLSRASRKAVQLVSTRINIGLSDGKGITSFSNAPQPLAYPAKGMMTISTCWPVMKLAAVSSRPTPRPWEAHGCGHSSSRTHERGTPTHGYAATREEAMAAFAKGWRRE